MHAYTNACLEILQLYFIQGGKCILLGQHHRPQLVADVAFDVFLEYQVGYDTLDFFIGNLLPLPLECFLKVHCEWWGWSMWWRVGTG